MATELVLRKLYDSFVPADITNVELMEALKPNAEFKAVLTQPRNIQFHKKAFALVKVAFDAVEHSSLEYKGQNVEKDIEQFRNDITILAGFYKPVFNYRGELRLLPKSWSFANMDEIQFEAMYSKLIDVILARILTNYTREDLDYQVDRILQFA